MNDLPRRTLIGLVRAEGSAILNDPQRLYTSLQSACGDSPNEVMALMSAVRQGVPGGLLAAAANPSVPWPSVTAAWVQRLQDQERMPPDYAAWAVDSWALALGVGPVAAPVAPPPGPPPSQPSYAQPQTQAYVPPIVSPGPGPQPQGPKSGKAGPILLVLVLAVIAAGAWYFFSKSRFDSALAGDWHSSMADGQLTWDRSWQVSSLGKLKLTETTGDAGLVEVQDAAKVLVLHSDHLGNIPVNFRFDGQEKLYFNGPMLSPGGETLWDWSTEDRGVPDVGKITFVGTWIISSPRDGLSGSMKLIIDYNSRYKIEARYSGDGTMMAKQGSYQVTAASGNYTDAGTYSVDNPDQIEFTSSVPGRAGMTWNRAHP